MTEQLRSPVVLYHKQVIFDRLFAESAKLESFPSVGNSMAMPRAPADRGRGHFLLKMVIQSPLLPHMILVKHFLFSVLPT